MERLQDIKDTQHSSILTIEGKDIYIFSQKLYAQLIHFPAEIITIFDEVAQKVFIDHFAENQQD